MGDAGRREALGQVFTPAPLAALLARLLGAGRDDYVWPSRTVLDPACGAGSLLVAVAEARRTAGFSVAASLRGLEGWDRDPTAAWLCRAELVAWALANEDGLFPPGPLRVEVVDALSRDGRAGELLDGAGVGAVIGNPPYLEAKRMGRAEPGLRDRLRRDFPHLGGAFDLYLAFCWRALDLVDEGGHIALLLPNKVTEGRYAAAFRERILHDPGLSLAHLVDLSRLQPRPFPGTSVYPAMLHLARGPARGPVRALRAHDEADLARPMDEWSRMQIADLRRIGGEHPLFVPFETWPDLAPLCDLPRLGSVARFVSTCSFHAKGLRERYVGPEAAPGAHPYLGGLSHTRRAEVEPFRVRWDGHWIRYDEAALRGEGNPLPDLTATFLRPKAIVCQHSTRVRVVGDFAGRWVTKDVYPVGWPTDPRWTLEQLVAVLGSTVFTAFYNTVYQGILVGGETYHYLPAFLHTVPVPRDPAALAGLDGLVRDLHDGDGPADAVLWDRIDSVVAAAYGVSEPARRRMIRVHLDRVGAPAPEVKP